MAPEWPSFVKLISTNLVPVTLRLSVPKPIPPHPHLTKPPLRTCPGCIKEMNTNAFLSNCIPTRNTPDLLMKIHLLIELG